VFGLSEKAATPGASRGKSRGVVLVRMPRRTSWLAGWSAPAAPVGQGAKAIKPSAVASPPANPRNRP